MKKILSLAIVATMIASPAFASGDVEAGKKVFKKCVACHQIGEGAKNKTGPILNNVFGRTAGTLEGYKYSKAMIAAGEEGLVWTEETLAQWAAKPKNLVKKTKMAFAGLKKEEDILNLEAYMLTFSPDYVAQEGEGDEDDSDKKSD